MVAIDEVSCDRGLTLVEVSVEVYICDIAPKQASFTLQLLAESLPLQRYGLSHLKRVRRLKSDEFSSSGKYEYSLQVLLCPTTEYDYVSEDTKVALGIQDKSKMVIVNACKTSPQTRDEYESWTTMWPTFFRPTELDRDREAGTHVEEDLNMVSQYMKLLEADCDECVQLALQIPDVDEASTESLNVSGGIVVNPENGFVVCTSSSFYRYKFSCEDCASSGKKSALLSHPLNTATMRCIESVACIVREEMQSPKAPLLINSASDNKSATDEALGDNHYLCSGLDLYLDKEPDLMSSMALVHSRIRRVYFRTPDAKIGALKSNTQLHSMRSLNHRYRAFHVVSSENQID